VLDVTRGSTHACGASHVAWWSCQLRVKAQCVELIMHDVQQCGVIVPNWEVQVSVTHKLMHSLQPTADDCNAFLAVSGAR
jgi:hypothetical protein